MVPISIIRWSPFFSGLDADQMTHIAKASHLMEVETGFRFFPEGAELKTLYLVKEGLVSITIGIPHRGHAHTFIEQLTRNMDMEEITISTIDRDNIFGWSALIPPYKSTASAVAALPSKVIALDCSRLRQASAEDCRLAYLMILKAAQVVRSRMRDLRMESLAFAASSVA